TSTMGSEMIQIDLSVGEHAFPWFPPFDNTTCDNIKIFNNKFSNGVRGIGTHSSKDGKEHVKIFIENNEFINMSKEAIHGLNWAFTRIKNNHFLNVFKGIYLTVKGISTHNHTITDNYLSGIQDNSDSRGIQIAGKKGSHGLNDGIISFNKVKRFGSHGVGVDFSKTWVIESNEISSSGKNGLIIYGIEDGAVTNNLLRDNYKNLGVSDVDIQITQSSENVSITGNTVS